MRASSLVRQIRVSFDLKRKLPSFTVNSVNENILFRVYPNQRASDLIENLQEELGQKVSVCTSTISNESPLEPSELNKLKATDLIRENYVLWLKNNSKPVMFDTSIAKSLVNDINQKLTKETKEIEILDALKLKIESKSDFLSKAVEYGILAYLMAQLLAVIVLTYQLGWDFMEPVTYILGLGTGVILYGLSCFKRAEFSNPLLGNWLKQFFVKRLVRKYRYSRETHLNLENLRNLHSDQLNMLQKIIQ